MRMLLYICLINYYIFQREVSDRWLAYESSPVDWCEDNFTVSGNIAEFTNTISNIVIILAIVTLRSKVWKNYTEYVTTGPDILFYLAICVGIGSCYFHGTLSLLGQFVDEILLMWLVLVSYLFFLPRKYLPKNTSQSMVVLLISAFGIFLSCLWFYETAIFCLIIFSISTPCFLIIVRETVINSHPEIRNLSIASVCSLVVVLTTWLVDYFMCGTVKSFGLPGIHCIFHLVIGFAVNSFVTLFAYWKAKVDTPHIEISIRYLFLGFPYVHCVKP